MNPTSAAPKVTLEPPTEFGGPLGALLFLVFTPIVTVYLWMCVHQHGGALWLPRSLEVLRQLPTPTWRAAEILVGWIGLQILLDLILPGKKVVGIPNRIGDRLTYRTNGLATFLISMVLLVVLFATQTLRPLTIVNELGPLLVLSILLSFVLGMWLYFHGLTSRSHEHRSGNVLYDFVMGTGLNPRIGSFDLKFFFESRIGCGTWGALLVVLLAAHYEMKGFVSLPMALTTGFQLFYVLDFFFLEEGLLSTWDIIHENFGFMLSCAFLVWMPFNFSLQSQYLLVHTPDIGVWAAIGLCVLNFGGYFLFRVTNLQKHRFRTDPSSLIWGKPPSYIKTKRGTLLLTAGFWGVARHLNYLGDLMMALAWCLTCGFTHVVPWFYFVYFAPLLLNRERRDNSACREKYGEDWDTYCAQVRWRILPGVY